MNVHVHEFPEQSMRWLFVAGVLCLLPVVFLPIVLGNFDPMHSTRWLLLMGSCWAMAAIGGKRGLWEVNKPVTVFAVYLIVWQVTLRLDSTYFLAYFLPALAAILAYPYLSSIDRLGKERVCEWLVLLGVLESLMMIGQRLSLILPPWKAFGLTWPAFYFPPLQIFGRSWLLFYPLDPGQIGRAVGTFTGTNPAAVFLAVVAVLTLGIRKGWAFFVILPALFLTNCIGGLLAACIGLIYFSWRVDLGSILHRRRVLAMVWAAMVVVLLAAMVIHGWVDNHRLEVWRMAFSAWFGGSAVPEGARLPMAWYRNPIIGWGPGSFAMLFPMLYQPLTSAAQVGGSWTNMHNEYLQVLWEYGLVGAGLLGWFMVRLWQRIRADSDLFGIALRGAVIAVAVDSLVFYPFQILETGLLALTMVAFLEEGE